MMNFDRGLFLWRVSPSLGAFGAHGHVRLFIKFRSFRSFLKKFPDVSAWFCVEESKKHCCPSENIMSTSKTDLDPKNNKKCVNNSF